MNRLNRKLLLCAATALAASSVAGCVSSDDVSPKAPRDEASQEEGQTLLLQAPANQGTTRDPNTVYFESVTANGTGCPKDTWYTSVSPDGLAFTITFSDYVAEVDTTKALMNKDCQLAIKIHSPGGISYAVSEFYYSGYALLEEGVVAEQTAAYGFQGTSVNLAGQNRTLLPKAPATTYDSDFVFKDTIETTDFVWSACGVSRDLNVKTRLTLKNGQNGKPRANGYANLAAIDGNTRLEFRLATRRCGDAGPGVTIPDAGIRR